MDYIYVLAKMSIIFAYVIFGEIIYNVLFEVKEKGVKLRKWVYYLFGNRKKLTPYINTGTYVLIAMVFVTFLFFFEDLTQPMMGLLINALGWKILLLFIFVTSLFVFWTAKITLKNLWKHKWVLVPLVLMVIDVIVWVWVSY